MERRVVTIRGADYSCSFAQSNNRKDTLIRWNKFPNCLRDYDPTTNHSRTWFKWLSWRIISNQYPASYISNDSYYVPGSWKKRDHDVINLPDTLTCRADILDFKNRFESILKQVNART